jgi:hypothetical protein
VLDLIYVTGSLADAEAHALGGRRVIGDPTPGTVVIGGQSVSLATDTWSAADGSFTLTCVKAPGAIYTIQTYPERLLPATLELRCNDWPAGATVSVQQLPQAIPGTPTPGQTVADLQASLQAYINANTKSALPFSDTRLAVTAGAGDMGLPNATGRALTVTAVSAYARIAPTGADLVVDVNKNGTTIFTNQAHRPRILAGATTSAPTTVDLATWNPGEVLTVDIDQIGSATAGGHLSVVVVVQG